VIELPGGTWSALGTAAGLGLVGVGIARGWRPLRHRRALVAAAACGALVVVGLRVRASDWPPPGWVILACDVGQGDALLIRQAGSDDALLVDVGPDGGRVTGCLRSAQVQRVDILLTHFHADHIDGLAEVLSRFPVREIVSTPVPEPTQGAAQVVSLARAAGVPLRLLRAGDRVTVGGVPLAILWPTRRLPQSPANNASVVALAAVATPRGPVTALLTGDIEPEAQSILLAGPSPAATVVKVPHHGSRYQVPRFAAWTGARIALVSVGQGNDYGHPSTETLAQYRDAGADIGRTDDQGDLAVVAGPAGPSLVARR
jgi:competence protein ComEC